jgi:hypothetical protein
MRILGGMAGAVAVLGVAGLGVASGLLAGGRGAHDGGAPAALAAAAHPAAQPAGHPRPEFGNRAGHAYVPAAGRAVNVTRPDHVIGTGTPAGCTSAAVVRAVARGGIITFDCGPAPVTITMTATARVRNTSHQVVLDGGGLVTLSGAGQRPILYQNTCDARQRITTPDCYDQRWPHLTVQNITLQDGNSTIAQSRAAAFGGGGGGAIFDLGGQLTVINSRFLGNRCHRTGPDLGGAAIRALAQWQGRPVYITRDTFRGGRCSNGGALSSIGVSWVVLNSVMVNNGAIGWGANPAAAGTPGGGSGGAIYTDGNHYSVLVAGSVIRGGRAREGGGAIFFVSDNNTGTLTIRNSTLTGNPSGAFWTRPYPGIYFHSAGHPKVINSILR